jgi:hypothetical protein
MPNDGDDDATDPGRRPPAAAPGVLGSPAAGALADASVSFTQLGYECAEAALALDSLQDAERSRYAARVARLLRDIGDRAHDFARTLEKEYRR